MIPELLARLAYNRGITLANQDRPADAQRWFLRSLSHCPFAQAWMGLGNALLAQSYAEAALGCFKTAERIDPMMAAARFNAGIALLSMGQRTEGWKLYESRFASPSFHKANALRGCDPAKMWDGSDLNGQTILVFHEQGMGDALMGLRYYYALKAKGAGTIIWRVPGTLYRLARSSVRLTTDSVVIADGMPLPNHDKLVPFMSLHHHCGMIEPRKYLRVYNDDVRTIGGLNLRVGLVWAGNPNHKGDKRRSIPFGDLAPLFTIRGVDCYALQQGERAKDHGGQLKTFNPKPSDFYDTACIIKGLDLVVTVDTAVAHLAGGLGVPTWLMLPYVPDFRWTLSGDRTVWYENMTLYRQPSPGDWASVVKRIQGDLSKLAHSRWAA